jgi:hypothetical protein
MSYCRFENTASDLYDCLEALNEGASPDNLSEDEARACRRLIRMCREIADDFGDLADG